MYFGSVRFFKHLIYAVLSLIIIVPTVLCIIFGIKYKNADNDAVLAMQEIESLKTQETKPLTEDEICSTIKTEGYSSDNILKAFDRNGINFRKELYENYYGLSDVNTYQSLYNDLYTDPPASFTVSDNTVYLTFDDGPSKNTRYILDILDKYDIKATFFVTGNETPEGIEILKEIAERGHTIGIHSYTHNLNVIYEDVDAFLEDMDKCRKYIYDNTGINPQIIRFAGGSINNYDRFVCQQIIAEVIRRGYVYYDWNVSAEDAQSGADWTSIYRNITSQMKDKNRAVILMHDSADKYNTVLTLDDIIVYLKDKGYSFAALDNDVKPFVFEYLK